MSSPSSPIYAETSVEVDTSISTSSGRSRTVAIIKTHALQHRFDIEPRISKAGFEIAKERQMEFDIETDPETLYELFGPDYESFAEGPVWVYVLERRRAVEVWNTLMGDLDPEIARQETSNSLRALYGINRQQNAVMGSPDAQTAEIQIMSIFASSPPFPPTELPDVPSDSINSGSLRSVSSSILSELRKNTSEDGYAASTATNPSTVGGSKNGNSKFRARPLPTTHATPDIVPRMSRAAALRVGIELGTPRRHLATKESIAKTFANVPGHKRSETIAVASTAPPAIAPRMTRAASLRLGQKPPERPYKSRPSTANSTPTNGNGANKATFEGVHGHKRRETITVASTKPPTVAPRSNRSASLRVQKESAPPTSFMFRMPSGQTSQPPSRSSSRTSLHQPRPSYSRPASATSIQSAGRPSFSRTISNSATASSRPDATQSSKSTKPATSAPAPTPKPKPRPSSMQAAPSIAPRTNKSALLRAQKIAAGPTKKPEFKAILC